MNGKISKMNRGFTLVELILSIGIFAFMTAFLVAKYGTFNQGILLTNLAYDVALTIRNAQSYGLSVKSQPITSGENYSSQFSYPYGVHFDTSNSTVAKQMIFFVDIDSNGLYGGDNEKINLYNIKRGSSISGLCSGSPCSPHLPSNPLNITFQRPDPNAIINGVASNPYAEITLTSSDGGVRKVVVRSTGQIAICNGSVCD